MQADRVLLSRRARAPKKKQWDLVGGFMEADETPEQAARREVREETGCTLTYLQVKATLPGMYAGRPTLNILAIGRIQGTPRAMDDSLELRWVPRSSLPPLAWPHEAAFLRSLPDSAK